VFEILLEDVLEQITYLKLDHVTQDCFYRIETLPDLEIPEVSLNSPSLTIPKSLIEWCESSVLISNGEKFALQVSESRIVMRLEGIIPPMTAPLLDRDTLDQAGSERLIEHVIGGGIDARL
jgi:hypothetical protein